jgi:hypothetical protein
MRATFPPLSSLEVSEELVASAVKLLPIIQVSPLSPHFLPFRGTCPVAGWGSWGRFLMTHRGCGATHRFRKMRIKVYLRPMRFCAFMKSIFIWQLIHFSFPPTCRFLTVLTNPKTSIDCFSQ